MQRVSLTKSLALPALILIGAAALQAQDTFHVVSGKAFDGAIVKDFYLEGNAIPAEKRNAVLIKTPSGARAEFALLDTSGYSSQVQQKYSGMVISEGALTICGVKLTVGSYGFGSKLPHPPTNADAQVFFYDQAGTKVGECSAARDTGLKQPKPLQVIVTGGKARLYLGVYGLDLQ